MSPDAIPNPVWTPPDDAAVARILRDAQVIAMVGASANPARPSFFVLKYLLSKGYRVVPVNPGQAGGLILGQTVYARLADIPFALDMVDVFRPSAALMGVVEEALALQPRPTVIWAQLTVRDDAAALHAQAHGVRVVMDRCPKIEYGRLSGEIGWAGVNSRVLSARRPTLGSGVQSRGLRGA